jgi:hypothetical protein
MLRSWQWDINNFTTPFERHQWARREAVPRQKSPNGTWAFQWLFTCKQLPTPGESDFVGQQTNFSAFLFKQGGDTLGEVEDTP